MQRPSGRQRPAGGARVPSVAVLIPCLNEEATVARVVADFRDALPAARIYVYDNGSEDGTARAAAQAGAILRSEPVRGKGNVVRRMFSDIDADVFVLVDGDDTYPAAEVPAMVADLLARQLDMVGGARAASERDAYPAGHRAGNALISGLVRLLFGRAIRDVLTGLRVLSRRFVKSFPAVSDEFEIETELTVHALRMRLPVEERTVPYRPRPAGSASKLVTVRDGMAIVRMIVLLTRKEKPLFFFALVSAAFGLAALALAWPLLTEYLATGLVPRLPTAVLATGLAVLGALSLACGVVLDAVTLGRWEAKRLQYLGLEAPPGPGDPPASA